MLFYLYTLDYPDHDVPDIQAEHVPTGRSTPPHLRHETPAIIEKITNIGLSESVTTHDPKLMNNVLVYAIAEKYDIPDLKALAKHKFQDLAWSKWPHEDLHAVVESVFSTTPDNDMGLRQVVLDICEEHFEDILRQEEFRAGFLEVHTIAAVVHGAAVRRIDHDKILLDDALAKQTAMRNELSQARADVKEALNQKYDWPSQLDALFKSVNKIDASRHCHEEFQWYLERLGNAQNLGMRLRCAKCQTKHTL